MIKLLYAYVKVLITWDWNCESGAWMLPTLRGGTGRGLLCLSREMKVKNAETARYFPFSASTSEETSTSTSISIDLLLTKVSRPVTVTTEPWRGGNRGENVWESQALYITKQFSNFSKLSIKHSEGNSSNSKEKVLSKLHTCDQVWCMSRTTFKLNKIGATQQY